MGFHRGQYRSHPVFIIYVSPGPGPSYLVDATLQDPLHILNSRLLSIVCVCVCAAVYPRVTVRELREEFFSGRHGIGGVVKRLLVVRIINRAHLIYFGKPDRKCECPYKVTLAHTHTHTHTHNDRQTQ